VPLYNLMEDAATAEICRAQVWQWIRHGAALADGRRIDAELVRGILREELDGMQATPELVTAAAIFADLVSGAEFTEFLTIPAYARLIAADTPKE
jgi:malate synthase